MADSRTLDVCRDFERGRCQRTEDDCRFAHPPSHVEARNGKVTCCVDSLKDRCTRDQCRYLHPPQHLKERLLTFGGSSGGGSGRGGRSDMRGGRDFNDRSSGGYSSRGGMDDILGGQLYGGAGLDTLGGNEFGGINPYLANTLRSYKAVLDAVTASAGGAWLGGGDGMRGGGGGFSSGGGRGGGAYRSGGGSVSEQRGRAVVEVCRQFMGGRCSREEEDCRYAHPPSSVRVNTDNTVTVCMDFVNGRCERESCRYFHAPEHLQRPFRQFISSGAKYDRKRSHGSANGGSGMNGRDQDDGDDDGMGPASKRSAY